MPLDSPRIFTIPAGLPFLDRLAAVLMEDASLGGCFASAARLEDMTILLPTRRAMRALGDAFLRASNGRAMLLPKIMQLGEDDDELLFDAPSPLQENIDLSPAISPLERQFRLARLILDLNAAQGGGHENDICRAVTLAGELGRFLDMAETEGADLGDLAKLVPDEFAQNWQVTVEFLKLLTARWPQELKKLGRIDPATRRNHLLQLQAQGWKEKPPSGPVIAAGSTGSIPATASLLNVIARLPQGAVILPGLDLDLDEESWKAVEESRSHPQYGMKQLLSRMEAERADVSLWPGCNMSDAQASRAKLLSETLRPAETTERWRESLDALAPKAEAALAGLSLIDAPSQRVEAASIALAMREVLETEGKTAALVTPDRPLARRVAAELRRWHIEIDDSAGTPLKHTPPVNFLRLVAEMVAEDFAPVPFLACLKHPLAALEKDPSLLRHSIRELETEILHGPRPGKGIEGLLTALGKTGKEDRGSSGYVLSSVLSRLQKASASFVALWNERRNSFTDVLRAHIACAEALAADGDSSGDAILWAGDNGEAAFNFLSGLLEAAPVLGIVETRAYPALFADLAGMGTIRPRFGQHPRLFIWGPLEARLQHADRMILGSLNEGTWPAETKIDPWLNRPMRAELGLEPPERRIGLSAHDFVMGASAEEVILTRAQKVNGVPAVPSRWILRLQSLLTGLGVAEKLPAQQWIAWASILDEPLDRETIEKPKPMPALEARPQRFSVTEIETLIRDPYAIYAKKILGLKPLDPLDADVTAAERGTIIHKALENFAALYPNTLPGNALEELLRIGSETFADVIDNPGVAAFWWPRFKRIAEWILDYERVHREHVRQAHAEVKGRLEIPLSKRAITLVAKADRIDELDDGTLAIIDYKTGQVPSQKQVDSGLSPQLPLEAAMAARNGFAGIPAAETSKLLYLRLTGGEEAGKETSLKLDELAQSAYENLLQLLARYEDAAMPYLSRPRPMFEASFSDYDHLARVKEWSASGGGEE